MNLIDARGEVCPKPVIMTKKKLEEILTGKVEVIVDNEIAMENLKKLADSQACSYEVNRVSEKEIHVIIEKTGCMIMEQEEKSTVIMCGTNLLGQGSEELGALLIKSFFYTVRETKPYPKAILFYNSGVKLCCEGSALLDDLRFLSEKGVQITACGTCLDYYELKEQLQVGEVGNMYAIYETASGASNTITLG